MTTEHKTLTEALAAFQAELPDVAKGSTNPAFNSKYADLADVVKVVLPKLAEHGLAWVTAPDTSKHGLVLRYELRHVSGESIKGVWPLPEKATAQQLGSWITYGRRYALSAVTGIAPDEDDDGNTASTTTAAARQRAPRALRKPSAGERIAAALAAVNGTKSLADLDAVWTRVRAGGLDGTEKLQAAYSAQLVALEGTEKPDPDAAWGPAGTAEPEGA